MSNPTLESISAEKTRVTERLAKIDIERGRLETQLSEYEAVERVMSRFSSGTTAKPTLKTKRATAPHQATAATPRKRGRPAKVATPGATPAKTLRAKGAKDGVIKLGAAVCNVIGKYPGGVPVSVIASALKSEYGMTVRPNHLGIALQRNKRGGRLRESDGIWYTPQAMAQAA